MFEVSSLKLLNQVDLSLFTVLLIVHCVLGIYKSLHALYVLSSEYFHRLCSYSLRFVACLLAVVAGTLLTPCHRPISVRRRPVTTTTIETTASHQPAALALSFGKMTSSARSWKGHLALNV